MTDNDLGTSQKVQESRVGFIGLGAMGSPMAARLAATQPTLVWARRSQIAEAHAREHGSIAVAYEAMGGVDVLVLCLSTSHDVVDVLDRLRPHLRAGSTIVDCTSGDPAISAELEKKLDREGIGFLDAPVSGGVGGAERGALTTMVGGLPATLARVHPVIDAFSAKVVHVGPAGAGHALKAVNNALMALSLWAASEGIIALKAHGIHPRVALGVINASSGRSVASERHLERRLNTEQPANFALSLMAKDVRIAAEVARRGLLASPAFALTDQLYDFAARSDPEQDLLEVWTAIEKLASE